MLAVAIATATSRALSYGTIYTTKLLRRGYDVDRAAPWRAFGDLKAADAMRPFPAPLPVAGWDGDGLRADGRGPGAGGSQRAPGPAPGPAGLPGPVTYRSDPQAVYAGESLAQTLRQLKVYGRDGLPVLSGDGQQAHGWITNDSVLEAVAGQMGTPLPGAATPVTGPGPQVTPAGPPTPLPGYQVVEITIGTDSPAAGTAIGTLAWPTGYLPVSVLRDHSVHKPDPALVLAPGDRISLLTSRAPGNTGGSANNGSKAAGTAAHHGHAPDPSGQG
jgi:chloride channel protein, CIC family